MTIKKANLNKSCSSSFPDIFVHKAIYKLDTNMLKTKKEIIR